MIVVPLEDEPGDYDWSYLGTERSDVVSHLCSDPYHYASKTIGKLADLSGTFKLAEIHDYGHPFQKLVEFRVLN